MKLGELYRLSHENNQKIRQVEASVAQLQQEGMALIRRQAELDQQIESIKAKAAETQAQEEEKQRRLEEFLEEEEQAPLPKGTP